MGLRLLVQPVDSVVPLVQAIDGARKSIELVIFRMDRQEIELALQNAVNRGVFVHALIARTARGGEDGLRRLEFRLLDSGITVARTAGDLIRYHDKLVIIDRSILYLLAFNFTYLDIERSRSFGIVTKDQRIVQEAVKLFEADVKRQNYAAALPTFLVSPVNARQQLTNFIKGARKELLIYDPRITDRSMVRLLLEKKHAGVDISIIGRVTQHVTGLSARKLNDLRLHTRTIIRDRSEAFIGSQSLRQVELDSRREAGIIVRNPRVVGRLVKIFEEDWAGAQERIPPQEVPVPMRRTVKKVTDVIARELPPITPVLQEAFRKLIGNGQAVELDADEIEEAVKHAVREAVREIVKDVVEDAVDGNGHRPIH